MPSAVPSKFPTTSAPSQLGDTNPPTSRPTALPTADLFDFESQVSYNSYLEVKADYANTTQSFTFGNYYYKGTRVDGMCDVWEDLVQNSLDLPFNDLYFSAISGTFILDDFETGEAYQRTFTCDDQNVISRILDALVLRTPLVVDCSANQWRVLVCDSSPVLCVNCKNTCVKTESCPGRSNTIHPCYSDCTTRIAAGAAVSFQYSNLIRYPQIQGMVQISATQTLLLVLMDVVNEGTVFCAALQTGAALSSVVQIRSAGFSAVVSDDSQPLSIVIQGLSPDTSYDVYCYSEDFFGRTMPLAEVRSTKSTIVTSCCKAIVPLTTFSSVIQYFPASGYPESTFEFQLNAQPADRLQVVLRISTVTCPGSIAPVAGSDANILPKVFEFDATSTSLVGSFVVRGTVSGCYEVSGVGTSDGADAYEPLTISTEIRNLRVAAEPPQLSSAQFSNTGRELIVKFDSDTDRAVTVLLNTYSSFNCSSVVLFPSSNSASCRWDSSKQLRATVATTAGSETTVLPSIGDDITLRRSRIRAACVSGCELYQYSSGGTVSLEAPSQSPIPEAVLGAASVVGSCDRVILDPTASSGSAGRAWRSIEWTVVQLPDNLIRLDIAQYLRDTVSDTGGVIEIPHTFWEAGKILRFRMTLENFLRQSAVAEVAVRIAETDVVVPQLRIVGLGTTSRRWNPIELFASATFPTCVVTEKVLLSYRWKVYKERAYQPSLTSESRDPRSFKLSPYTLDAASKYTFQVTVTVSSNVTSLGYLVLSADSSYQIQIGESGVSASIAGPSTLTTSASNSVTLDASASSDIDYPDTGTLSFAWTCTQLSPSFGTPCTNVLPTTSSAVLTIPVAALTAGRYNLSVVATNPRGSFDTAFVTATFTSRVIPKVSAATVRAKYNAQSKVTLTGSIVATGNSATAVWSSGTIANLATSNIPVTPLTSRVSQGTSSFQLSLGAYRLTPGLSYSFTLSAAYIGSADTATSSVIVVINSAPTGGVVQVSPASGTALTTVFAVRTSQWVDDVEDLPLRYRLAYYTSTAARLFVVKNSGTVPYVNAVLGQGLQNLNYVVQVMAFATDVFEGEANATIATEVLPVEPSPALTDSTSAALDNALADKDSTTVTTLISASVNAINAVDCNVPFDCGTVNREVCTTTARTCGQCLRGYVGIDGHSNVACQLASNSIAAGGQCTTDESCFSGNCESGVCADVAKSCPNDCSGAADGTCVYRDSDGGALDFCSVSDDFCSAVCVCRERRFGADCSLTGIEFDDLVAFREAMCTDLYSSLQFQDVDAAAVSSRAQSVAELLVDPQQSSDTALEFCTAVLVTTVLDYPTFSCLGETPNIIVDSLSRILAIDSSRLSASLYSNVTFVVEQLSTSCQSQLAVGESPAEYLSEHLKVLSSVNTRDRLNGNQSFSVAQSAASQFNGVPASTVTLNATRASEIQVFGMSLVQYGKNPQGAVSNSSSVTVQVDSYDGLPSEEDTRRRRLATAGLGVEGIEVTVTLINKSPIVYMRVDPTDLVIKCTTPRGQSYDETRTCPTGFEFTVTCPARSKGNFYITCPGYVMEPRCTTFDDTGFSEDPNCQVVSYDAMSTTCSCADPLSLVGGGRRRRMSDNALVWRWLQEAEPVATVVTQYASRSVFRTKDFASAFDELPQLRDEMYHDSILVSLSLLDGLFILGLLALGVVAYRRKAASSKQVSAAGLGLEEAHVTRQMPERRIYAFYESLVPHDFRRAHLPWRTRFAANLQVHHTWAGLVSCARLLRREATMYSNTDAEIPGALSAVRPLLGSRSLEQRWVQAAGKLLTFLFVNTLLAYWAYPHDSQCGGITSESECEDRKATPYFLSCEWSQRHESCRYMGPPLAAVPIVVLLSIVLSVSVVYNRALEVIIEGAFMLGQLLPRDRSYKPQASQPALKQKPSTAIKSSADGYMSQMVQQKTSFRMASPHTDEPHQQQNGTEAVSGKSSSKKLLARGVSSKKKKPERRDSTVIAGSAKSRRMSIIQAQLNPALVDNDNATAPAAVAASSGGGGGGGGGGVRNSAGAASASAVSQSEQQRMSDLGETESRVSAMSSSVDPRERPLLRGIGGAIAGDGGGVGEESKRDSSRLSMVSVNPQDRLMLRGMGGRLAASNNVDDGRGSLNQAGTDMDYAGTEVLAEGGFGAQARAARISLVSVNPQQRVMLRGAGIRMSVDVDANRHSVIDEAEEEDDETNTLDGTVRPGIEGSAVNAPKVPAAPIPLQPIEERKQSSEDRDATAATDRLQQQNEATLLTAEALQQHSSLLAVPGEKAGFSDAGYSNYNQQQRGSPSHFAYDEFSEFRTQQSTMMLAARFAKLTAGAEFSTPAEETLFLVNLHKAIFDKRSSVAVANFVALYDLPHPPTVYQSLYGQRMAHLMLRGGEAGTMARA